MIVAMLEHATEDQIQDVTDHLMRMGFAVHRTTGARQTVLARSASASTSTPATSRCCPASSASIASARPTSWRGSSSARHDTIVKFANGIESAARKWW